MIDPPCDFGPAAISGGGAHAADGASCGTSGADAGLVRAILRTVHKWKASHAALVAVVVPLGGAASCGDGNHAGDIVVASGGRVAYLTG